MSSSLIIRGKQVLDRMAVMRLLPVAAQDGPGSAHSTGALLLPPLDVPAEVRRARSYRAWEVGERGDAAELRCLCSPAAQHEERPEQARVHRCPCALHPFHLLRFRCVAVGP